jgi:hypothetical protein
MRPLKWLAASLRIHRGDGGRNGILSELAAVEKSCDRTAHLPAICRVLRREENGELRPGHLLSRGSAERVRAPPESYVLPRTIGEVDGSKPDVVGHTHSEMHLAASAQDSRRDTERRADLGRGWIFGVAAVEQALTWGG